MILNTILDLLTGKDVNELGENDVAIGQRILFHQHLQFLSIAQTVKPNFNLTHWAVKCGSLFYHLQADGEGKIITVECLTQEEKRTFTWEKKGEMRKQEGKIEKLIKKINKKEYRYRLLRRNCQHVAAGIANYALKVWSSGQVLDELNC